jgi:hypothetical protein
MSVRYAQYPMTIRLQATVQSVIFVIMLLRACSVRQVASTSSRSGSTSLSWWQSRHYRLRFSKPISYRTGSHGDASSDPRGRTAFWQSPEIMVLARVRTCAGGRSIYHSMTCGRAHSAHAYPDADALRHHFHLGLVLGGADGLS